MQKEIDRVGEKFGVLVCRYALFYDAAPRVLKFWVPFISIISFLAVALIEGRVAYGFITGN